MGNETDMDTGQGVEQTRKEIINHHAGELVATMRLMARRTQARAGDDEVGSLTFAACMLEAIVLDALTDAYERPEMQCEAESLLFAELGDDVPPTWPYETVEMRDAQGWRVPVAIRGRDEAVTRMEGEGERLARWHQSVRRVRIMMDAVMPDPAPFRAELSAAMDRLAARSTVTEIAKAAEVREAVSMDLATDNVALNRVKRRTGRVEDLAMADLFG